METTEKTVRRFRRQAAGCLFVKRLLELLTVGGFFWGAVVVVLRAAYGVDRSTLAWGALILVPLAAAALAYTVKHLPGRRALRAALDRQAHSGGLIMAQAEVALTDWRDRLPVCPAGRLRWRAGRTTAYLAIAAAFVAVSFLLPARYVLLATARPLDIGSEAAALETQIETLAEEEILSPDQADNYQEKLAELQAKAQGTDPVTTWETLDRLQEAVNQAAQQGAQRDLANIESLAQTQTLLEAIDLEGGRMDAKTLTQAMAEMNRLLGQALKDNPDLAANLPPGCLDGQGQWTGKAGEAGALRGQLGKYNEILRKRLERLAAAGLVDLKTLQAAEKLGQCNGKALGQFLAKQGSASDVAQALAGFCGGQGGIQRGRGDAQLTWKDATVTEGADFTEQTLPNMLPADLADSDLIELSQTAPAVEAGAPAIPGQLALTGTGGGSAHTAELLPRHKAAVKRYFERKK
ncbi:MAG: hypothetical protein JW810_05645 [Sedimentisphaerales bacterium]|nr:hypothetical protein [Sedimentisphaerales bacterium]